MEARVGDVCVALSPGLPRGTPALLRLGAEPPRPLPARPDQARRVWSAPGRSCRRRGSLRAWPPAVDGAEDAPAAAAPAGPERVPGLPGKVGRAHRAGSPPPPLPLPPQTKPRVRKAGSPQPQRRPGLSFPRRREGVPGTRAVTPGSRGASGGPRGTARPPRPSPDLRRQRASNPRCPARCWPGPLWRPRRRLGPQAPCRGSRNRGVWGARSPRAPSSAASTAFRPPGWRVGESRSRRSQRGWGPAAVDRLVARPPPPHSGQPRGLHSSSQLLAAERRGNRTTGP